MKHLIFTIMAVALFSCAGAEETDNENQHNGESNEIVQEEVLDMEISDFKYFEDYAKVKTRKQLYDIFGEENLADDTTWFGEGTTMFMCTDVKHPESGWMIRYVFDETQIDSVSFIETNFHNFDDNYNDLGIQEVKANNGLYTGMPLKNLVEWNGGDFEFSGFGWDYEGGINYSEDSKLGQSKVMVSLTMHVTEKLDEKYQSLYSDGTFKSTDELVQTAPIVIGYMSYFVK